MPPGLAWPILAFDAATGSSPNDGSPRVLNASVTGMVQGRKQNRRIEIHSPEPADEALDNGFDVGSGDEPAISLEDLGDAYAAVLQMHQSLESHGTSKLGTDDESVHPDGSADES
ncbi:MAG: hypothetical protein ACK5PZ_22105, partial [Pirellula sp.]